MTTTSRFAVEAPEGIRGKAACVAFALVVWATMSFAAPDPRPDSDVRTVVIDAGHGGHDHGCRGRHSREKEIALKIALKLGAYIEEKLPDVKVIYTRKTDVFVELHERATIANRADADVFISIHCNAASPSAYGTETFVMGLHRSEANLQVAKRENAAILLEDNHNKHYNGFDPHDPTAHIIFSLAQNAWQELSANLAGKIEAQFRDRVSRHSRGVKQAGFLVLYQTAMPSVLVETGFLTHREEEKFLLSSLGQDYMASALFRAFRDYKVEMDGKTASLAEPVAEGRSATAELALPATAGGSPESISAAGEREAPVPPETKTATAGPPPTASRNGDPFDPEVRVWLVQIYASHRRYKATDPIFRPLAGRDVYRVRRNGLYKYMVGQAATPGEAARLRAEVRTSGFPDAFIVSYTMGELANR